MKINFKTDKWKSDRALQKIKIDCPCSEMHIFGVVTNDFQSSSHFGIVLADFLVFTKQFQMKHLVFLKFCTSKKPFLSSLVN